MLPEYLHTAELNPLMNGLAGTPWLFVVKDGWVLFFLVLILVVKDRKLSFGKGLFRRRITYKTAE